MHMVAPVVWTPEMVRALPDDGQRYETVHGELLVTPAPRVTHQRVLSRLLTALVRYLDREPIGELLTSPADISLGDDSLVQPDLFVVDAQDAGATAWADIKHLLLVVEVLSPSSVRADCTVKRALYQSHGIPTYWAVDADARVVEVWTPLADHAVVERERLRWRPTVAASLFELELTTLFA